MLLAVAALAAQGGNSQPEVRLADAKAGVRALAQSLVAKGHVATAVAGAAKVPVGAAEMKQAAAKTVKVQLAQAAVTPEVVAPKAAAPKVAAPKAVVAPKAASKLEEGDAAPAEDAPAEEAPAEEEAAPAADAPAEEPAAEEPAAEEPAADAPAEPAAKEGDDEPTGDPEAKSDTTGDKFNSPMGALHPTGIMAVSARARDSVTALDISVFHTHSKLSSSSFTAPHVLS